MPNEPSLLNRINSNNVLKYILSLAYSDMKLILKFIKHIKNLMKKLDINIKDYYKYNCIIEIDRYEALVLNSNLTIVIILFIIFLIYNIIFWVKGVLNEKILKEGYSIRKKIL
jgi:hypothetical protein